MPTVYRAMLADGDKPRVGTDGKTLGVRVPPNPRVDLPVDPDGSVHPQTGGMSVSPAWRQLPFFLIPRRLRANGAAGATGRNDLICWRLGEGPFDAGELTPDLSLRPDPQRPTAHGFVEPGQAMSVSDYQQGLAATREQWVQDEA